MSPAATRRFRVTGMDYEPIETVVFAANAQAAFAKASLIHALNGLAGDGSDACGIGWRAEPIEPESRS